MHRIARDRAVTREWERKPARDRAVALKLIAAAVVLGLWADPTSASAVQNLLHIRVAWPASRSGPNMLSLPRLRPEVDEHRWSWIQPAKRSSSILANSGATQQSGSTSQRRTFLTSLPGGEAASSLAPSTKPGNFTRARAATRWTSSKMVNPDPLLIVVLCSFGLLVLRILYVMRLKRVAEFVRQHAELRFDERERTARELQDNLLQGLQGLVLRFQVIADQTSPTHKTSALIDDALARADAMLVEGRERVRNLRLGDGDLPKMLERLADDSCLDGKTRIKLLVPSAPRELRAGIAHELTEIAREAMVNACRHADASRMQVSLIYAPKYLRLMIEDNGRGISPEVLDQGHGGIARMQERATRVQGDLSIQSRIGLGTLLSIAVPARDAFSLGTASSDYATL